MTMTLSADKIVVKIIWCYYFFSFIRNWPQIWKWKILSSEFCPISGDTGMFGRPKLAHMSLMQSYHFWVKNHGERENQHGGSKNTPTQIRVNKLSFLNKQSLLNKQSTFYKEQTNRWLCDSSFPSKAYSPMLFMAVDNSTIFPLVYSWAELHAGLQNLILPLSCILKFAMITSFHQNS